MRKGKRFQYLIDYREFKDEKYEYDLSELSVIQRMIISADLNRKRLEDERKLSEIMFDFKKAIYYYFPVEFPNDEELIKKYFSDKEKYYSFIENADVSKLKMKEIPYEDIFLTRNGQNGRSIKSLCCKAFSLGISKSNYNDIFKQRFFLNEWTDNKNSLTTGKTKIKKAIQNWMTKANISGEFKGNCVIIYSKKNHIGNMEKE